MAAQESTKLWLDGFWGNRHSKMPKIPSENFFLHFWAAIIGFTNCFEILNFAFSNIVPRRLSTCKILTF